MDGELDVVNADEVIAELKHKDDLLSDWKTYHVISEVLRQPSASLPFDVARRVSDQLVSEPILFMRPVPQMHKRKLIALSTAASFVALITGWLIMQTSGVQKEVLVAEKVNNKAVVQIEHPISFQPTPALTLPFIPHHSGDYSLIHRGFSPSTMLHAPVTSVYQVEEKDETAR